VKSKTKRILTLSFLSILGLALGSIIGSVQIANDLSKGIETGLGATLFTPLNFLLIGYMPVTHLLFLCMAFIVWVLSIVFLRKRKHIGPIVTFISTFALGIPNAYLFKAMLSV
jgi:hypothetical protein